MTDFILHPQLADDTYVVGDLSLCTVRLMDDAQYPWLILVPQTNDSQGQYIQEIYHLPAADQTQLWQEITQVSEQLMQLYSGDKINVAALGNMVPQLHVHIIVRYQDDPAWPAPVWGAKPSQSYAPQALVQRKQELQAIFKLTE